MKTKTIVIMAISFASLGTTITAIAAICNATHLHPCNHNHVHPVSVACYQGVVTCGSQTNGYVPCTNASLYAYQVNDYPQSCVEDGTTNDLSVAVYSEHHNCNKPLQACYRPVSCHWDGAHCVVDEENVGLWTDLAEPSGSDCD